MPLSLKDNMTILFQGDSITDAHREQEEQVPNSPPSLGRGYAMLAAAAMLKRFAEHKWMIHNRGISGNKVSDLMTCWQEDCLDVKPDLLSILIGVNDFWRTLDSGETNTVEQFEIELDQLLANTKAALPHVAFVIGEPFVTRTGHINEDWFPEFDVRREVTRKLAEKHDAIFVPYQSAFDKVVVRSSAAYWTHDGIHPTLAGHQLMADLWLKTVFGKA